MDPVEEVRGVFIDGSNEGGCSRAVSLSIERIQSWKYLNGDVPLTGLCVGHHHVGREGLSVESRRHDLQISDQRPQVAVVGSSKRIDGRIFKPNTFLSQHSSCDATKRLVVGPDEVDFEQVFGEAVPRAAPGRITPPQTHLFVAGEDHGLFGLLEKSKQFGLPS